MTPKRDGSTDPVGVSIVILCPNETATARVRAAIRVLQERDIAGEVVVADSSADDSQVVAASPGARVVRVEIKGYGNSLKGGVGAARGRYIIIFAPTAHPGNNAPDRRHRARPRRVCSVDQPAVGTIH